MFRFVSFFIAIIVCANRRTILLFPFSKVPERARGYLFEYEVINILPSGSIIRYTDRIYKPGADTFETFKETEEQQTMPYPTTDLESLHDSWQRATGKCNARLWTEREALLATQGGDTARKDEANGVFNVDDIDDFFQKNGRGSHLLEFEFKPDTPKPVAYTQDKTGRTSHFWCWTHKLTKVSVKRYATVSGKSQDSGVLSKYLHRISQRQFPLAYARAQQVLSLNESRREQQALELAV